jgi:DNA-binding protein HU-beta
MGRGSERTFSLTKKALGPSVRETLEGGWVMTKAQFVAKLAEASDLSKKQADTVLNEMVIRAVKKGEPVKIPNLGTWRKRKTSARMGRNPQTGEPIKIPARTKVRFTVAKSFKDAVLGSKK